MKIELTGVTKSFGKVRALAGIDLSLPAKAKVALIGPNGSGKTTLIRVLLGLVRHEGSVRIDGFPVHRADVARRIAYVPQIAPQIAASCSELIRAICELREIPVARVTELAAHLDLAIADVAGRPFRSLSGGSKQKLLIALAFAARPELIVLDEPTASLDAESRGRFFELQQELLADATLILCSHRLDEIRSLVDHVVALEEGALTYDGDAGDYLARRVGTVLELRIVGEPAGWLPDHGFARGVNGWWSRTVDRDAKLALVPVALDVLGEQLVDLSVRDVDLVELRQEVRRGA